MAIRKRAKIENFWKRGIKGVFENLDENGQVEFKSKAKAFVRSYGFLAAILTYGHPAWEKLAIFLNFLIPKLPAPKEEDLSKGVLRPSTWTAIGWKRRRP